MKISLETLAKFAVSAAIIKFTFEGGASFDTHTFSLGHADATTYAMLLGPVLAHNAYKNKPKRTTGDDK